MSFLKGTWMLFGMVMDLVVIAVALGLIFDILDIVKGPNWNYLF